MRYDNNIVASYKMVDTCAAEFEAATPYYYSVYGGENESVETNPPRRRYLYLVQVLSESDRVSSSTSVQFIVHGHLKKKVMKQLL